MMLANSLSELGLRMESVHRGIVSSLRINEFLDLGISSATYFKSMIGLFPDTCQGSIVLKMYVLFNFLVFCFCFFFQLLTSSRFILNIHLVLMLKFSRVLTLTFPLARQSFSLEIQDAVNPQFPTSYSVFMTLKRFGLG